MNKNFRVIKPDYSRFKILYALRRHNKLVVVYDIDNPVENKAYSTIHEMMWDLNNEKLVVYDRNIGGTNSFMMAKITQKGRTYFNKCILSVVGIFLSLVSAIAAITAAITCANV